MHKNKSKKPATFITRLSAAFALSLLLVSATGLGQQTASAVGSSCQSIADCTNQINNANSQVTNLKNEAVSYKDAIGRLSHKY